MVNMTEVKERSKKPIFLVKVVELVLTCVCLRCVGGQYAALLGRVRPEDDDSDYKGVFPLMTAMRIQLIIYAVFLALLLIVIVCYMLERPFHYMVIMTLAALMAVLSLAGAAINLEIFLNLEEAKKKTMVGAVAGAANFVVFLADILLTYQAANS